MDHRAQGDKNRASYVGNVKNRLGSKLPAEILQPSDFINAPCSMGSKGVLSKNVEQECVKGHHQIRNPKLRQYYLKEPEFPAEVPNTKTLESLQNNKHEIISDATVDSVASPLLDLTGTQLPKNKASPKPPDSSLEHSLDRFSAPPSVCCQREGPADMSCLRLNSRYITDRKGVVSGILLVTPSKIFFDPQKSHSLVQENGCEEYVFSCSVDDLATVSFYTDISHIHFNKTTHRGSSCKTPKSKFDTQSQIQTKCNSHQMAIEAVPTQKPSDLHNPSATPGTKAEEDKDEEKRDMAEAERQLSLESGRILTTAATFCCGGPDSGNKHTSKIEEQSCLERHFLGSCTAISESGSVGSLMFVRFRWKQQHGKRRAFYKPKFTNRDTWFTMHQESSDKLYVYLSQHWPYLCVLEGDEEEKVEEDFVLLDEDDQEEDESPKEGWVGDDWEMITVEESVPRASYSTEPEGLNDILNQSVILDAQQINEISKELPPRTIEHTWHLAYSTDKHGASLKTLYRKLSKTDSPVLILIKDFNQQVFGSFLSHPLHPSEAFYGTGETFLFLSHPRFKCFRWTGENSFFIKGNLDSFAIGGGSGHFGLWVDERLYFGRSNPCFTFNNCSLSETNDFTILELEAWTFS